MIIPAPKRDELIERIKERLAQGELSEIDFRRFELDAQKIKKTAPDIAFSALGVLACIRGDAKSARSNHDKSIKISPAYSLMYHNYAVSLARLGYLVESTEMARKAISLDRLDKRPVRILLEVSYKLGNSNLLEEALSDWHKISGGERHFVEDYLLEDADDTQLVDEALDDIEAHGTIPWDEIAKELSL